METSSGDLGPNHTGVAARFLGPLAVTRNGVMIKLPASRKVRALFAYLAMSRRAVGRSHLCDLLWDGPNDPRGELRWSLSKLRAMIREWGIPHLQTSDEVIGLELKGCVVDAVEAEQAIATGIAMLDNARLQTLCSSFAGDFLEGLEIDHCPAFEIWLTAQRRRFHACHIAIVEHLAGRLPVGSLDRNALVEKWIELAPFDGNAHLALLKNLAERGQIAACGQHLLVAARRFDAEELDFGPVLRAWQDIKSQKQLQGYSPRPELVDTQSHLPPTMAATETGSPRRASLAIMPFLKQGEAGSIEGGIADGLTHDIITRLARLRNLFIIARGSVYALAQRNLGADAAGRALNVDYIASGAVRYRPGGLVVSIELVEVRTARIVWTEVYDQRIDDTFLMLDEIGNRIVASISGEIESVETNRAILKAPSSLSAWEAYHRGLWHMYRFTRAENELAQHFFGTAVRLDPTFARAYAGLSFTHWQSAFQRWGEYEYERDQAFETAGQSLLVDDRNPAAHWAMGRALWLRNSQQESVTELELAVDLSPNFALGHYALSFVQSQSGDAEAAILSSDHSRLLSPFDPLLFGMLGARAMAHVRLGEFQEAAEWAMKAAARPNAHNIILAIAAHCLALAGRLDEARMFSTAVRKTLPHYCFDDFANTFRFTPEATALFRQGAKRIGLD
ncbi:transcriptional regulator [Pararhizobium sp. PWRC1-1]|uniref:transcriptional regulator n=1 Tax=Pararhizobium sp. PWRC1-1 TaxID=2804566 RepID=UPI003CF31232